MFRRPLVIAGLVVSVIVVVSAGALVIINRADDALPTASSGNAVSTTSSTLEALDEQTADLTNLDGDPFTITLRLISLQENVQNDGVCSQSRGRGLENGSTIATIDIVFKNPNSFSIPLEEGLVHFRYLDPTGDSTQVSGWINEQCLPLAAADAGNPAAEPEELDADSERTARWILVVPPGPLVEVQSFAVTTFDDSGSETIHAEVPMSSQAGGPTTEGTAPTTTEIANEGIPPGSDPRNILGDDQALNGLATQCFEGDMVACDDLYAQTPSGSDLETYSQTCGGRIEEVDRGPFCETHFAAGD